MRSSLISLLRYRSCVRRARRGDTYGNRARCCCCLLRDLMSFSFSCSNWKGAALAAESFLDSCRRHRKSIHNRRLGIGFGGRSAGRRRGVPPTRTREADRTTRWLLYLWSWSLEPEEWRGTRQPDERRVRNRCQHRREAPHSESEMGLMGRSLRPQASVPAAFLSRPTCCMGLVQCDVWDIKNKVIFGTQSPS